jgi:hypothetical protein
MGFVIRAVVRQGGGRPSYRAYSGRTDNAAGGRPGAKTASAAFGTRFGVSQRLSGSNPGAVVLTPHTIDEETSSPLSALQSRVDPDGTTAHQGEIP